MFDKEAEAIPGKVNEKSIKMYLRERRMIDQANPMSLENHDGPTLILVKTADFTTTGSGTKATSTRQSSYDSHDDDDRHIVGGAIAGIIIGVIVVIVALITCCCYACGCKKGGRGAKPKIDGAEHARIIAQGTELMQQRGTARNDSSLQPLAPERVEETRAQSLEEPPPKYTP
jgi:hypothetical protein